MFSCRALGSPEVMFTSKDKLFGRFKEMGDDEWGGRMKVRTPTIMTSKPF